MLPLHPLDSSWFVETHLLPRSIAFQIASYTRRFASSFLVPRLASNPKKMLECLSVRQLLALVANCWRTPVLYARRIERLYLISQWFPKPWVAPSAPSSWWQICLSRSISHHHIAFLTVGRPDGLIQFCPYGEVRQAWYFARYGAEVIIFSVSFSRSQKYSAPLYPYITKGLLIVAIILLQPFTLRKLRNNYRDYQMFSSFLIIIPYHQTSHPLSVALVQLLNGHWGGCRM